MVEDGQAAEVAGDRCAAGSCFRCAFPDRLAGGLGDEQRHALAVVHDQPLDEHQADEGLAQAHAVAQERAAVLAGDLHQGVVALLLVLVEDGYIASRRVRACCLPLVGGQLVAAEELVQGLGVDLEGRSSRGCAAR